MTAGTAPRAFNLPGFKSAADPAAIWKGDGYSGIRPSPARLWQLTYTRLSFLRRFWRDYVV